MSYISYRPKEEREAQAARVRAAFAEMDAKLAKPQAPQAPQERLPLWAWAIVAACLGFQFGLLVSVMG